MFDKDYDISGKHATYTKYLSRDKADKSENSSTAEIFSRYIDVYMNGAIFGLLFKRLAEKDTSSKDIITIPGQTFINERENCDFLFRLVMLLDESTGLSPEERVDRAFRFDSNTENNVEFQQNMELFNKYVRGGIEVMYERFIKDEHLKDDYLKKSFKEMKQFKKDLEKESYGDDDLENLISKDM